MKAISREALELIKEGAPHFIRAVRRAVKESKGKTEAVPVVSSLMAFEDDPLLLYACLWYAWSEGATVMFWSLNDA